MNIIFKHSTLIKSGLALLILLVTASAGAFSLDNYLEDKTREVILLDGDLKIQISTTLETVGCLLEKYDIVLGEGDVVSPTTDVALKDVTTIEITRAFEVFLSFDGRLETLHVINGTVSSALEEANVKLNTLDEVNLALNAFLYPGIVIAVSRVHKETIFETEQISYQVVVRKDRNREQGSQSIVQQGQEGQLKREFEVVYRDGAEVSRELIEEAVAIEPKDHIVLAGTLNRTVTSRGDNIRYAFSRVFEVTAYTHTGNPTRTGVMPKVGHVAVDPRVIPLNSTIYVDFSGRWNHLDGFYKATDTGGVIDGDIIDIFMYTEEEAIQFGRRRARVYLLR